MQASLKGKARGQFDAILFNGRLYDEDEIRTALKAILPKPKNRGSKK